jgi:hypothetical protein
MRRRRAPVIRGKTRSSLGVLRRPMPLTRCRQGSVLLDSKELRAARAGRLLGYLGLSPPARSAHLERPPIDINQLGEPTHLHATPSRRRGVHQKQSPAHAVENLQSPGHRKRFCVCHCLDARFQLGSYTTFHSRAAFAAGQNTPRPRRQPVETAPVPVAGAFADIQKLLMQPVEQVKSFGVAGAFDFVAQIVRSAAVAQRVQAGPGLAARGAGSRGLEGVGAACGKRSRSEQRRTAQRHGIDVPGGNRPRKKQPGKRSTGLERCQVL